MACTPAGMPPATGSETPPSSKPPPPHHTRIGADFGIERCEHRPVLRELPREVIRRWHGRRQRVELALDVDQTRHVADRLVRGFIEHRKTIREHHREPPVVVAVGQLGVVDVDLAHVHEELEVVLAREDLLHHRLGNREIQSLLDVLVRREVEQRRARRHALRNGRRRGERCLAFGDDHEREPRNGRDGNLLGGIAFPRQRAPLENDLWQPVTECALGVGRREAGENLVGRHHESRRGYRHVRVLFGDGERQPVLRGHEVVLTRGDRRQEVRVQHEVSGLGH